MIPSEYLKAEFWHPPPRADRGDQSIDSIYTAVGYALSQWERLEISNSRLFAVLVETDSPAAQRAYGALVSAIGRLEAIDNAAEVYFSERESPLSLVYDDFSKVMRWAVGRRNDIAHGFAESYAIDEVPGGGYYLMAPAYNSRKNSLDVHIEDAEGWSNPFTFSTSKYALTSNQIREMGDRFSVLDRASSNLSRRLRKADQQESLPPPQHR